MQAGIYLGPGKIKVSEIEDPQIQHPDEAIVKVTYSCICGSDLWTYRGLRYAEKDRRIGHEFIGEVIQVGKNVKKIKVGDKVIAPFAISDGTCPECKSGITTSCRNVNWWGANGNDGGQGEQVRVPFADGCLFKFPKNTAESLMPSLLTLSDVMCTGYHAAISAGVSKGKTVAIIGDGAVGLSAVLASKILGAKQIILLSHHIDRAKIGKKFGATDIVSLKDDQAVTQVKKLTADLGVDCALECVGNSKSWDQAFKIVRPQGKIGFVGVPVDVPSIEVKKLFDTNIGINGGVAPAAFYIPTLLPLVLSGKINPGLVFTKTISLNKLAEGYKAMDQRETIKVLIKF